MFNRKIKIVFHSIQLHVWDYARGKIFHFISILHNLDYARVGIFHVNPKYHTVSSVGPGINMGNSASDYIMTGKNKVGRTLSCIHSQQAGCEPGPREAPLIRDCLIQVASTYLVIICEMLVDGISCIHRRFHTKVMLVMWGLQTNSA